MVDEIHAFAGDDRGWHLLAVLSRIEHLNGRRLQRIGLSATVGNPAGLLRWFQGNDAKPGSVISPVAEKTTPDVTLDFVGSYRNAAQVIAQLHRGEKRLVFVDSRNGVERLAGHLRDLEIATHVSHSSLSADERARSEQAFANDRNCVIVATSTLELGIDVGDLDRVIQIDAPTQVSSFLQRLGRTGRRQNTVPNCLFLATDEDRFMQAAGLTRLWADGFVEPCSPPPLPYHLLAHQLMALALQEDTLVRGDWIAWLANWPILPDMPKGAYAIEKHLLDESILAEDGGVLFFGTEGERRYGFRYFSELYSVFLAPPMIKVLQGRREIGEVDPANFVGQRHTPILSLGGRAWRVTNVDWERKEAQVVPAPARGRSLWRGGSNGVGFELAQACMSVLMGNSVPCAMSQRAQKLVNETCQTYEWLEPGQIAVTQFGAKSAIWTFAGWLANLCLAERLEAEGLKATPTNWCVEIQDTSPVSASKAFRTVLNRNNESWSPVTDRLIGQGIKFRECVPPALLRRCFEARYDCSETIEKLRECKIIVIA